MSGIRTTDECVQRRRAGAVRDGNGTSELDEVGRGHVAVLLERLHDRHNLVETDVRVVLRLGVGEDHDRTISASTTAKHACQRAPRDETDELCLPELALRRESRRESDSVVECQAERVVRHVIALSAVEQVLLQIITDREERAARRVGSTVLAIWAKSPLGDGT